MSGRPTSRPDRDTGIGNWSDAEIKTALQEGRRPAGHQLAEAMPSGFYKIVTPRDLDGIVAYLRSLPSVDHKVPGPVYKMQIPLQVFPGAEKPMSEPDLDDKVKRGFYLVTIAHCMACHTPLGPPATGIDFKNALGKGGRKDGTKLKPPMGYPFYAKMTDRDLDAMVAYLRTVPAKE